MVFVFSVIMVWGMFLAARDVLIGWIAAFCFLLPFMCAFFMNGAAVRHGRRGYLPLS